MNLKVLLALPMAVALSACSSLDSTKFPETQSKIDESLCVYDNGNSPSFYKMHYKLTDRAGTIQSGSIMGKMSELKEDREPLIFNSSTKEYFVSSQESSVKDGETKYKSTLDVIEYGRTIFVDPIERDVFKVKFLDTRLTEMKKLPVAGGYIESPVLEENKIEKEVEYQQVVSEEYGSVGENLFLDYLSGRDASDEEKPYKFESIICPVSFPGKVDKVVE